MKLAEQAAKLDRLQRSRLFKIIATVVVIVLAGATVLTSVVTSAGDTPAANAAPAVEAPEGAGGVVDDALATSAAGRSIADLAERARDPVAVTVATGIVAGVLVLIIWIGMALTYVALGVGGLIICGPLYLIEGTREWGTLLSGVFVLWGAFAALLRGAGFLLAGPGPVFSIARNVLNEAARMKLSVVFIVLLVFGLAALPGLLNEDSPLRYRVQSFLQYGTGGAFWLIALLTVTFSVATVAFEQRDRVIWQTMTKPVRPWQYILGKWLGVSTLGAVLLTITSTGVFLFVEYLRQQPAVGERQAYIAFSDRGVSEDRRILESQVLASRVMVKDEEHEAKAEIVADLIQERLDTNARLDPAFRPTPSIMAEIEKVAIERADGILRTIPPGGVREFTFPGIDVDAAGQRPVILRYRVDTTNNAPDELYKISISVANLPPMVRQVSLGTPNTLTIAPMIFSELSGRMVIPEDPIFPQLERALVEGRAPGWQYMPIEQMLTDDGDLVIQIVNGDWNQKVMNPDYIQVPQNWIGVSYTDGSYYVNFARVAFVLWLKLSFLAMLGITAATFLSFSVSIMVTMGSFLVAEASGYMADTIDYFAVTGDDRQPLLFNHLAAAITRAVTWLFETYTNLRPTQKLVGGEAMGWGDVSQGVLLLGAWTLVLWMIASLIFRRRELATYSGR